MLAKREETNQENSAFELELLDSNRFEKLPTADGKISDTTGYDAKAYANVPITDIRAASEGIKSYPLRELEQQVMVSSSVSVGLRKIKSR